MKVAEVKDWLQVIAIIAGGAWAIWTFAFKTERDDVVFRGRAASAIASCSLDVIGRTRGFYIVKARSEIASSSKIKLHIFNSPYVFLGTFAAPITNVTPLREFSDEANKKMLSGEKFEMAQQYGRPTGVPMELGRLWVTASYLEPNEKVSEERIFLVSEKNAQAFDWVTYSFALVFAEDVSRLGLSVKFDALWNLVGEVRVFEKSKKNPYSLADEPGSKVAKVIPVYADGISTEAPDLQTIGVGATSARCNLVLPNKRLNETKG